MKSIRKIATVAGAVATMATVAAGSATALSALSALPASAATLASTATRASTATLTSAHHGQPAGTVFVQTDGASGNAIVAYDRTASGGLRQAGTYPTGGDGGQLSGSVVDHLASEGSLAYDRQAGLLYAANAGSSTITVFAVRGDRLARLQVIGSGGQFPVSIAVRGSQVYVLNARDGGAVAGFLRVGGFLVPVRAWHRALGLDPAQVPEFTSTPGQVAFTPDGSHLVVTTKNGANTVDVFGVGPFGPSAAPAVTSLPGTVPFGFTFDARGHLVLTEAGPNVVATFRVARDGALSQLAAVATGQAATCWITAADGTLYASNAGSGTESVLRAAPSGALTSLGTAPTDAGTVDATASGDGRFLYVQTGGAGIVDAYRIGAGGALTEAGSVTVPGAVGAEGIAAS